MGEDVLVYVPADREFDHWTLGTLMHIHGRRWHWFLRRFALDRFGDETRKVYDKTALIDAVHNAIDEVDVFREGAHRLSVGKRADEAERLADDIASLVSLLLLVEDTGAVFVSDYAGKRTEIDLEERGYVPVTELVRVGREG